MAGGDSFAVNAPSHPPNLQKVDTTNEQHQHYRSSGSCVCAIGAPGVEAGHAIEVIWDMTTVGFIGSGQIGSAIARLAIDAGHQVVLSNSRGPETLTDVAAELGPRATAATSWEAAATGDIVVVSVPVSAFPNLPAAPLPGKTVIDTCNYGSERDGSIPELDSKSLTSSELLQRYIPGAMLVKGFNNIFFKHLLSLARPAGAVDRSYLPIAGDSAAAKAAVTEFIDSIGYGVVNTGSLAESWRQATGTPVWGTPYGPYSDERGQPAGEDDISAALASATP